MAESSPEDTEPQRDEGHLFAQRLLGLLCYALFVLPYCRRIRGLAGVSGERRLFLCNHVSLLDTILLGGIFWSRGRLPILVLGDSDVWHASRVRRFLSSRVGFLIQRRKTERGLLRQLESYGRSHRDFNLILFPEGTRGDGLTISPCQPGTYTIAKAARIPIVPVFISGMQAVSTKTSSFRPLRGLRQVQVEFGAEISPDEYLPLKRGDFCERVQTALQAMAPRGSAATRS